MRSTKGELLYATAAAFMVALEEVITGAAQLLTEREFEPARREMIAAQAARLQALLDQIPDALPPLPSDASYDAAHDFGLQLFTVCEEYAKEHCPCAECRAVRAKQEIKTAMRKDVN